jgi:RNA polymerase sigma-70 factor (ECF subfamily)
MATAEDTLAGAAVMRAEDAGTTALSTEHPGWLPWLVEQNLRRVLTLLYRMVGNYADAQELAQDVFLKAYQRRHQLREPQRVLGWLFRIASNAAIDFQRAHTVERAMQSWDESIQLGPPSLSPEQHYARAEGERRLHEALRLLSPKERAAIVLRDLEGLSGPEVARLLGCSQVTVRTHIASARVKLRQFFEGKLIRGNKG